jgi:hypothetical protein
MPPQTRENSQQARCVSCEWARNPELPNARGDGRCLLGPLFISGHSQNVKMDTSHALILPRDGVHEH